MRAAVLRYRVMAYTTGVLIIVLCFVGIPLQIAGHPQVQQYVGEVHGFLYIVYVIMAFLLALQLADDPPAAGRHDPGDDVRRRALDDPPLHRPGPRRRDRARHPGPRAILIL